EVVAGVTGRYLFLDLQQAGFNVRASAKGYPSVTRGINLTSNIVADFALLLPLAAVEAIDELTVTRRPGGGFDLRSAALNNGLGCASSVKGATTVRNKATSATLLFPWTLPPAQVIQPDEKFPFDFGPMTEAQALAFPDNFYSTTITFI